MPRNEDNVLRLDFLVLRMGFPGGSDSKESICNARDLSLIPGSPWSPREGKGMANYSSILAWRIPWTEEPHGLQSMGLQRVRHDWATNIFTFHFPWNLKRHRSEVSSRTSRKSSPTNTLTLASWDPLQTPDPQSCKIIQLLCSEFLSL